ncbi:MAG: Z1 domain-containing protein [Clostridium sp.]|nr:MAG: Z1 domain-containing protein [Clostridium sp.]
MIFTQKDFILTIPANDGYCGIKEYFGVDIIDDEDVTSDNITDLVVNIHDYDSMFGENGKITAQTSTEMLSDSLKEAIMSFVLAASIKKSRGFDKYNSMLIHIARYKNPSTTLKTVSIGLCGRIVSRN